MWHSCPRRKKKEQGQERKGTDQAAGVRWWLVVVVVVMQLVSGTSVTSGPEINDAGIMVKNGTMDIVHGTDPEARWFELQAPGGRRRVT